MKPFITFEGGEGAGKSTLIERVYETLHKRGVKLIKTRAPGGTRAGAAIRSLLLEKREIALTPRAELLLFLADRAQHVDEIIVPALQKDQVVLCDRFNDSTVAYQGVARDLGESEVRQLCLFACQGLEPNLTLYLDLDPRIGLQRLKLIKSEKDKIEQETLAFHDNIRAAFHKIAEREPRRFHILDASKTPDQVFHNAMEYLDALLPPSR